MNRVQQQRLDMARSTSDAISTIQGNRAPSTLSTYTRMKKEFTDYCDQQNWETDTLYIVDEGKLLSFLQNYVLNKRTSFGKPLAYKTIRLYTAAVTDLYKEQFAKKCNSNPNPRTGIVKSFLDSISRKVAQDRRDNFDDLSVQTHADGISSDAQRITMHAYFLEKGNMEGLRDLFMIRSLESMSLRGEIVRGLELSHMSSYLLSSEGTDGNQALQFIINAGKTNQHGFNIQNIIFTYSIVMFHVQLDYSIFIFNIHFNIFKYSIFNYQFNIQYIQNNNQYITYSIVTYSIDESSNHTYHERGVDSIDTIEDQVVPKGRDRHSLHTKCRDHDHTRFHTDDCHRPSIDKRVGPTSVESPLEKPQ